MDARTKKELVNDWKNRHPEMGVISFRCKLTGETFLGISKDTNADYNSNRFKLQAGIHPNKQMQKLWNEHGEECFEYSVLKILEYDDPQKDQTDKLIALRNECMENVPQALLIWK